MRTFYIFKINKELAILTKDSPYNLFKSMEKIYKMDKDDFNIGVQLFEQVAKPLNKERINQKIFNKYKDNDYYTKFKNIHKIHNRYKPEESKMIVNKVYILLQSSVVMPVFLNGLNFDTDLFACDFENKDYFWLDELRV